MCDRKRSNKCPLCRKCSGTLPLVNGLTNLIKNIHYTKEYPIDYVQVPCSVILKSGKRKGQACQAKCMIGPYTNATCKRHHTAKLKKEEKDKGGKDKQGKASTNQPWHDTLANYQNSS